MHKYIIRYSIFVESNLSPEEMTKDIALEYIDKHVTSVDCPEEFVEWQEREDI